MLSEMTSMRSQNECENIGLRWFVALVRCVSDGRVEMGLSSGSRAHQYGWAPALHNIDAERASAMRTDGAPSQLQNEFASARGEYEDTTSVLS